MARAGLANLISLLRVLTNTTPNDITLNGETYFADDHLQMMLDSTQQVWTRVPLIPQPVYIDGAPIYLTYALPNHIPRFFEEGDAIESGWFVYDSTGTVVDLADYTPNYPAGTLEFAADTDGGSFTISCRTYNLYRAASNIWLQKASFAYQNVDWTSDNHQLQASQEFAHAVQMAEYYATKAGSQVARLVRSDEIR